MKTSKNPQIQRGTWLATAVVAAGAFGMSSSAPAQSLSLSDFPAGFTLNAYYASWSTATINNSAPGFQITSSGYGSGYYALPSVVDGSAYNAIQMTVDVAGISGFPISSAIADLTDADGTQVQYAMQYGLQAGTDQTFTMLLSAGNTMSAGSTPGLDLHHLTDFNIEDDPGGYSGQYTITYRNLSLVATPEPASLALLGLGSAALLFRRKIAKH